MNTLGTQQITVYYGNLTTTFTVTVTEAGQAVAPTLTPAAVTPNPLPSASPSVPAPTTVPTAVPTATVAPTMHPSSHNSHQSNLGRSLISIIVITAVMALAVLGAYVFVMNQGGFEGAAQKIKELFRRRK